MIAFAHRDVGIPHDCRQAVQSGSAGKPAGCIHRRSRINPVFIIAAFTAALLFDGLSSAIAQRVFHRMLEALSANPVAAIAAALVLTFVTCLVIKFATARFARSRAVNGATRAKT